MRHRILALFVSLIPAALGAQGGTLVGYLVDGSTSEPLAYGVVGITGLERTTFTSDSGRFAFIGLTPGQHQLHVRRLGFTPRDISFAVRDGVTDTMRVELTRVAVRLGAVDVKSYPSCVKPGAPSAMEDSAMATVVDQIRLNAEQYKFLADQYPYRYVTVVSRSRKLRGGGNVFREAPYVEQYESSSKSTYRPGAVIRRSGSRWIFAVPTLVEVADKAFVDKHCWHYGGTETFEDEPLIRVDAVAFDSLRNADVNGTFLISPLSFQLRKSTLHLSRRPREIPELMDMEITSEFFEVLPSISILSRVKSVQLIDTTKRIPYSEAYEEHVTQDFKWLKRSPANDKKKP